MNIFIARLSSRTSGEDLQNAFSRFGEVTSAKVIFDRDTGNSKRYGFVEMDDEAGRQAIEALNESELDGSRIVVKEARPRSNDGNRGGYNSGNRY
jgi:RNA recognition motif-containing protein